MNFRFILTAIYTLMFSILLSNENSIEGRWHLVGYEDNVMYQFVDTELFAEAGYRYTIYSIDGNFGGIEDGGGSPNPYSISDNIITMDLFFGTIVTYEMNFICDGQVVEFIDVNSGNINSILFREGYNYLENSCNECVDLSGLDFGPCEMVLGIGYTGSSCSYVSGCGGVIDGIDYTYAFFDSMEECEEGCELSNQCDPGFVEINDLCFHEGDIGLIQTMIDNSYESGIDLGCSEGDNYCGSPNPFMDSADDWGWIAYDGTTFELPGNENGVVEPLELGIQEWQDGRLIALDCGAYIYCQLSGQIPEEINSLTELNRFRVEGNYFSGTIPETICDLNIDYNNNLDFDVRYNRLCAPYPDCIDTDDEYWGQFDESCDEIGLMGDLNNDNQINVIDVVIAVDTILNAEYNLIGDLNEDGELNIIDVVILVNLIIDPQDSIQINSGTSYGECLGYCEYELNLDIISAQFIASGWSLNDGLPNLYLEDDLDEGIWSQIIQSFDFESFQSLDDIYGCPDCADGGAEFIEIIYNGTAKQVTFEAYTEIGEIEELTILLRNLRESYWNEINENQECYIAPEVGPCEGICPTFYFNQETGECEEFITGCCGVEAFDLMESCQELCE